MTIAHGAEDVHWDLTRLYRHPEGEEVHDDQIAAEQMAEGLSGRLHGKVGDLDAAGLADAVEELQSMQEKIEKAQAFAYLDFATDTADPERGAFVQHVEEHSAVVSTNILFFELEWAAARSRGNEIADESVQALVDAVTSRYDIPARWYRLKGRLLGIDDLSEHDRYAPIDPDEAEVGWDEARETVLDAYRSFSPEMADIASEFFDGYIDAPPKPGKQGGAFSHPAVPSAHPYVMLNYTGRRRDVITLPHELGHGVHKVLAHKQGRS